MFSTQRQKLITIALGAALALGGCGGGADSGPPQQGNPPVTVAVPLQEQIVDWDDYVGRFEAMQSVEVRPRATGYLSGIFFRDGEFVQKNQLLFTVDTRPAKAALAQAQAQLAQAQATLANARTQLARSETLFASQAASKEEVESRRAEARSAEAQVAGGQATVRARQLDLDFTRVTAPISGRISERRVDAGNSVQADQTVLTTIVSVSPLHFVFQGSETLLLKYQRGGAGTRAGTPVRIKLSDETDYVHAGTLDFVDNAVDSNAGTIRARAVVSNANGFLKPGMFGSLRLEGSAPYNAMLVPDTSIVADGARQTVLVVDKDGTVIARPVETGPLVNGLRVIRNGITAQDRVIIGGIQRARPGQKVTPQPGKIQKAAGGTPPPAAGGPGSTTAQPTGR